MKRGLDTQEEALKVGRTPGDAQWGHDSRPGTLTLIDGDAISTGAVPGVAGDYRRYYALVRDAIRGAAPNPVPASEALAVMKLLALGCESNRARREQ